MVSGRKLKIELDKSNGNSEMADKLTDFIKAEQNENNKYKVSVEYDEDTELIKYIVIEIVKE